MNKRYVTILRLLDKKKWLKGSDLAKECGVTARTIRNDIQALNQIFPQDIIESNTRKGYRIKDDSDKIINQMHAEKNHIPQTPEERTFFIIKKLLFIHHPLRIYDLQEMLYVSLNTIESDIKRIRKLIKPYTGVKLIRSNNQIYFEGSENAKRKLYRDLVYNEIKGNFLNLNKIASHYDKFDLVEIANIFEKTIANYNYELRDSALPLIMLHIGIMTERMMMGYCLDMNRTPNTDDKNSEEFNIAEHFLFEVKKILPIQYNEQEIYEISNLLIGYANSNNLQANLIIDGKLYSIDKCIHIIIDYLSDTFDIDFSQDDDFAAGLHLHLQSLIKRTHKNVRVENTYLNEVKTSYPLIFEMSVHIARIISDYFNIQMSEAETGFISLHLGAAYERNIQNQRHRAVLITSSNQAFSKVTEEKLSTKFKDRMEIVATLNYFEKETVEQENVDLIICVKEINHSSNIPTVKISMFVNTEDESRVFSMLNKLDQRRSNLDFAQKLTTLIEDKYFYPQMPWSNVSEIIHNMCQSLYKDGIVDENFEASVLERESYAATSFEAGIATPHPLLFSNEKSQISIATLKEPVLWGNYHVKLVILLLIGKDDQDTIETFFNWLSRIISNEKQLEQLINAKSRDRFVLWMLEDID